MKRVMIILVTLVTLGANAQQGPSFEQLLVNTDEVQISDSLHINVTPHHKSRIDTGLVKKWLLPLLGSANNNRLKNRGYYLLGKITSNPKFQLLVIMEEKKKSDTIFSQVVYLITTKKDGTWIASMQAAIAGSKRKSRFNTSSWLYKDYKVVLDSKMVINEKEYADMSNYKINGTGRFILYPNYD